MNDDVSLSLQQFVGAWKLVCSGEPGHHIEDGPGLSLVFGMLPIPFFNVVFLTAEVDSQERLQAIASEAKARAAGWELPWFFVTTHELFLTQLPVTDTMANLGMVPALDMTGMLADKVDPLGATPDSLSLVRPADETRCAHVMEVNGAAYGIGSLDFETAMASPAYWERHFPVVGYVGDKPVTSSDTIIVGGHRYVAFVASDPQFQRRGFAQVAIQHSLDLAAEVNGRLPSVLHATEAGRPLYARMGYRPISTHTCFIEERFAH